MIACKCGYKSLNFFDSIARLKSVSTWCVSMAQPYFSCKRFWIAFCAVGMFLHSRSNRICLLFASLRAFVHFAFRFGFASSFVSILHPNIRLQSCILGKKRGELPPNFYSSSFSSQSRSYGMLANISRNSLPKALRFNLPLIVSATTMQFLRHIACSEKFLPYPKLIGS